jgi:cell division protein FtsL
LMAAPRRYRATLPTQEAQPVERRTPVRTQEPTVRRKAAGRRRRFAMIVVVPVLLMLGSVYLHTVSAALTGRTASLQERVTQAQSRGERLEVRVAKLSGADRIRPLAGEKLGMQEPSGDELKTYEPDREDGTRDGGEKEGGKPR